MDEAFYLPDGEGYQSTSLTRGPWDNRFQHGGPPAALLAGAMAQWGEDYEAYALARVSIELLRPVPLARLLVTVRALRLGRSVQRLSATLSADGTELLRATGLRIRRNALDLPARSPSELSAWPDPESLPVFTFPFFRHEVGYHQAIDLRIAHGQWGQTPIGVWTRPVVPLVAGRMTHPVERVMIIADAQSGMGVPLDPTHYSFINPDLTVYFEREPRNDWLGFDIRSVANGHGGGLSQSAIRDRTGLFGRSAQSLVVRPIAPDG